MVKPRGRRRPRVGQEAPREAGPVCLDREGPMGLAEVEVPEEAGGPPAEGTSVRAGMAPEHALLPQVVAALHGRLAPGLAPGHEDHVDPGQQA